MPHFDEFSARIIREPVFQTNHTTVCHNFACGFTGTFVQDTWGVASFLQVHTKINHIDENLCVHLWLGRTPHDAEAHQWLPVLGDKSWRSEEHTSELQSRPHLVC